jgi:hypothetical protein
MVLTIPTHPLMDAALCNHQEETMNLLVHLICQNPETKQSLTRLLKLKEGFYVASVLFRILKADDLVAPWQTCLWNRSFAHLYHAAIVERYPPNLVPIPFNQHRKSGAPVSTFILFLDRGFATGVIHDVFHILS